MLNRNNLELARLAPDQDRATTNGLLVEPCVSVVTDGKFMMIVGGAVGVAADFPAAEGYQAQDTFEPFIIPKKAALDILKALPTAYAAKGMVPALSGVAVADAPKDAAQNGKRVVMYTTDLETHKVFQFRTLKGPYANWRIVVPDGDKATSTVSLSVEYITKVFTELKAMGVETITMRTIDKASTVRFDGIIKDTHQHVTVLVAPYNGKEAEAPSYSASAQETGAVKQAELESVKV